MRYYRIYVHSMWENHPYHLCTCPSVSLYFESHVFWPRNKCMLGSDG